VAVAVGVPFIDSVGKLETKLEDFLGKSARVDKDRQKLFESANKLLDAVKKIDAGKSGPENAKRLTTMGDKVRDILDRIGTLEVSIEGDNTFYRTNAERCKVYRRLNGKPMNAIAATAGFAVLAGGILATAKSIVDIATALA
jgi:hypothetical protein